MPSPRQRPLSSLGEFGLIERLARRFGSVGGPTIVRGIGDDAAVVRSVPGRHLLASTDMLVEDVHFDLRYASLFDVGYRAAAANLSDIAAMGGFPEYVLMALAIPQVHTTHDIDQLYRGFMALCGKYHVRLIGGDTSSSPQGICLAVSILGHVAPHSTLRRDGAKVGDQLYLSGTVGDSLAGLLLIMGSEDRFDRSLADRASRHLIKRHLRPTPRLELAQLLAARHLASAAIDISDGLSSDLGHLCRNSKVGAVIHADALPISSACRSFALAAGKNPVELALQGGEDFELLFTVPQQARPSLDRLIQRHRLPLTRIGTIQDARQGLRVKFKDGSHRQMPKSGFDHFRQPAMTS